MMKTIENAWFSIDFHQISLILLVLAWLHEGINSKWACRMCFLKFSSGNFSYAHINLLEEHDAKKLVRFDHKNPQKKIHNHHGSVTSQNHENHRDPVYETFCSVDPSKSKYKTIENPWFFTFVTVFRRTGHNCRRPRGYRLTHYKPRIWRHK